MKGVTRNDELKIAGISLRRLAEQKGFRGPCRRRSRVSNYEFGKTERLLSRIMVHRCVSVGFRFLPQLEC